MRVTEHPEGSDCWAELDSSDGNAAKAFYTGLFGWRSEDNPMGPEMVYTTYYKGDASVAASYNEQEQPPHWGAYILSKNADETVHKARLAHGTVVMEPFDVMEFGRMAVLQDPTGEIGSA